MLTGEPKDALHQLRTRVCSLLFIVRGYCAPEIGIRDGAGARGRITHQCEPASVPGLGSNELWSHWWVIRAFIPAHNAITYGCSLKMSTKRVVSFVKKKVSVKSQELYSMLVKNCKNNDAMPPCCNFHNIPFLRQVIFSSPKQSLSRLGKRLFAKSKVHSL